jgi:hypothetical protein
MMWGTTIAMIGVGVLCASCSTADGPKVEARMSDEVPVSDGVLSTQAVVDRLEAPPQKALPGGWEFVRTVDVTGLGSAPKTEATPSDDVKSMTLDESIEHAKERFDEALTGEPSEPAFTGTLYYYGPADKDVTSPMAAIEQREPFMVVGVFPKGSAEQIEELARTSGLSVNVVASDEADLAFAAPSYVASDVVGAFMTNVVPD